MSNANIDSARLWCETHLARNGSLQRDGRTWLCSNPTREDRNPSLSADLEKRVWHDFATGEAGTLRDLAGLMGVEAPQWDGTEREEKESHSRATDKPSEAVKLWKSGRPAQADHEYLLRKKVAPHGCRESTIAGERILLIPAYSEDGHIVGVERIKPDGSKQHLGQKAGAFFLLGAVESGKPILLTEGFATAASVHEATGYPTVCSFGAANVPVIARRLREKHPDLEIIAATDNDDAGEKAAAECPVGTFACIPDGVTHTDWNDTLCLVGPDEAAKVFEEKLKRAREKAPMPKKKDSLGLMFYDELTYTEPEFLVAGLIEKNTTGLLFGATATKKSFIALDIAACVATGAAFHGRVVEQGPVIYLAGEGSKGIGRRLKAWEKHFGVSLKGAPLLVSMRAPKFGDSRSAKEAVDDIREKLHERGIIGAALVVVDTLARAAVGLDENSNQAMGEFVDVLDGVKTEFGCVVLAVHHSGYMETGRARGASSVPAAMDFIFAAKADGSFVTLTATKVKDAEEPAPITFECVTETIGAGRYGEPLTSLVLEEVEVGLRRNEKALTKVQLLGLDTFREAAKETDSTQVHIEQWREVFYRRHTGDSSSAKKVSFQRVRKDLVELGKLSVQSDMYSEVPGKFQTEQNGTKRNISENVPFGNTDETEQNGTHPIGCSACSACVPVQEGVDGTKGKCSVIALFDKEPEKKEPVLLSRVESEPVYDPFAVLGL